jgi:hypothetical protein
VADVAEGFSASPYCPGDGLWSARSPGLDKCGRLWKNYERKPHSRSQLFLFAFLALILKNSKQVLRICSKSFKQKGQESHVNKLQARVKQALTAHSSSKIRRASTIFRGL